MADDREPYEPLWAERLRRDPGPSERREAPEEEKQEPETPTPFPTGQALAIAALVVLAVLLGAIIDARMNRVTFADLPSYWGNIEMTCATVRIEEDDRTLEAFRCRPDGSGGLPAGFYRPPDTNWNSDFDRRPAADHAIRISASGEAVGWAIYRP